VLEVLLLRTLAVAVAVAVLQREPTAQVALAVLELSS
jgi:hypothetical protein